MKDNQGGPAFPRTEHPNETGMTLRDYFAAQMLASVMSATSRSIPDPKMIATACYKVADAMLEARK
jgi:hypothetical protein